jgi:hypothetical protein
MHQRPQREHQASVFTRSSAQTLGETLAHEIERRPGFVERRRLREAVIEHLVGVGMLHGELEITLAGLGERSGAAESCEELDAGLDAYGAENIFPIAVALVERGRSSSGDIGDAAHGKRFFASPGPEPAGRVENAFFKLRICLSRQTPASVPQGSPLGPTALTVFN